MLSCANIDAIASLADTVAVVAQMPGATIGDCTLEKRGQDDQVPRPMVTKQLLDDAKKALDTKFEGIRDGVGGPAWAPFSAISDEMREYHMQEMGRARADMDLRQELAKHLKPSDQLEDADYYSPINNFTVGRLVGLPEAVIEKGEPILCNIMPGASTREHIEPVRGVFLKERVEEMQHLIRNWVNEVVTIFKADGKSPKCGRVKPLLAMPMVGTGRGGGVTLSGLIADMMVDLLPRLADEFAVDILLCITDRNDYQLLQQRRKQLMHGGEWGTLTSGNLKRGRNLAGFARKKNLCYFIGAGMSIPAGLPMWGTLLELIDRDLGFPLSTKRGVKNVWDGINQVKQEKTKDGVVVEADGNYTWADTKKPWDDYLEIAEELHRSCVHDRMENHGATEEEGTKFFKKVVAVHCDSPKHAVGHAMLANIPARSSITTNYDTLFEKACHGVEPFGAKPYSSETMAVLPWSPKKECNRWLLKMHGCCSHTDDIVLTADDYAKYESSGQAALGGLVQAELMTSHMMFTGFSMTDANFKRLIDSVMKAYGDDTNREGAGTIISLGKLDPEIKAKFKEYGIGTVVIAGELEGFAQYDKDKPNNTNPAREMEVFMDYMLLQSTDTAYPIFEPKFASALNHSEKSLRNHLREFLNTLPREVTSAPAWSKVKQMFKTLGAQSTRLNTDPNQLKSKWIRVSTNLKKVVEAGVAEESMAQLRKQKRERKAAALAAMTSEE